jgi:hypothetical protein
MALLRAEPRRHGHLLAGVHGGQLGERAGRRERRRAFRVARLERHAVDDDDSWRLVQRPVPPPRDRRVAILFSTQAVYHREYRRRCTQFGCPPGGSAVNRYQTAYASRYAGPDFRDVIR